MHGDDAHHVAVWRNRVFFGSTVDNQVYALHGSTGEVLWTFFTEGPVRDFSSAKANYLEAQEAHLI